MIVTVVLYNYLGLFGPRQYLSSCLATASSQAPPPLRASKFSLSPCGVENKH